MVEAIAFGLAAIAVVMLAGGIALLVMAVQDADLSITAKPLTAEEQARQDRLLALALGNLPAKPDPAIPQEAGQEMLNYLDEFYSDRTYTY